MASAPVSEQRPVGHRRVEQNARDAAPADTASGGEVVSEDAVPGAPVIGPEAQAVTVIVVTHDSEETIAACLDSIPRDCAAHVVDNASRDGTLACIATANRPRLRVTRMERNEGFGRACNRALGEVQTAQALLLNPDAAIAPAALARLSALMATTPDLGVLAPRVIETGAVGHRPEAPVDGRASAGTVGLTENPGSGDARGLRDVREVTGSCMLLDVEKVRSIGFFDENIFLYYEDSDLCWRARAAGFRVCVATDAVATHRSGDSSSAMRAGDLLRERLIGQSYAYFTAKHHPRGRRRIARKVLAHLSAGIGCIVAGRPARARVRFARMRGLLEYLMSGPRALWANRLAER